ncbi:hypothetical protein COK91_25610 [Bacillus cereus]|nr:MULTISPECIES: hypothetical protein [Bacillus cereus group]PFU78724.1 hypothetical protein COK91_25610 [Bacillus cereus]PGV72722.1 hypothetical protein COD84_23115 [Bacillus cereus]UXP17256.1 hypothetical protein N7988_27425 [Bacillus cereus]
MLYKMKGKGSGFILKRRYKTVKKEIDIYYPIVSRRMKRSETLAIKKLEEHRETKGLYLGRMKPNGLGTKTKRLEKENGMLEK